MNCRQVRLDRLWLSRFYRFVLGCFLIAACSSASAQDWKKVHRADEEKWAKTTGLDPSIIHKISRMAANDVDEKDDDSRIANVDLEGLAERHDVLFVTYAGEKNCLTITVFRRLSATLFKKQWSVQQSPDGTGFCDTDFGSAAADATNGIIAVSVPHSRKDGNPVYTVYAYDWNGISYRFAGQKEVQGR